VNVQSAVIEILKREGTEFIVGYPVNALFEAGAEEGIRPIITRQERVAVNIAEAYSRLSVGRRVGVVAVQMGPGIENAFCGVAQAYSDCAPLVVLPTGWMRPMIGVAPNFDASLNFRHVTKSVEQVRAGNLVPAIMRRAFTQARNGRPGPAMVEIPVDMFWDEVPEPLDYSPSKIVRNGPDPGDVAAAATVLLGAKRPVIYAGQGIHYAQAWPELREVAELLGAPVLTSLPGKSAFPENHPLSLGSGGAAKPATVNHFLQKSDVIFGIGCSFTWTLFGVTMPVGKIIIHATLDPADLNKDLRSDLTLLGDAKLTLEALIAKIKETRCGPPANYSATLAEIRQVREAWLAEWKPKLESNDIPFSPYRVIWDMLHTVDVPNTIITHDSGSPREQLSAFWQTTAPLTYIGWGKDTPLGSSLGFAMGAKLAQPDKLCIAFLGDAAIGMTGMDLETAVREHIPILVVVSNNLSMACELRMMPVSTEKYRSTDISGNYAEYAKALGAYGERIIDPQDIVPAIRRGIDQTREGVPALLEFMTCKELDISH
jgi:thiamine pyrophosphate-dependent acetolactate synthase large subunit-like protein